MLLPSAVQGTLTVAAIATAYPSFSTLLGLVKQANLAGALSDTSASLTLFAPTGKAFAALPAVPVGTALRDTLTYHLLGIRADSTTAIAVAAKTAPDNQVPTLLPNKKATLSGNATAGLKVNGASSIIYTDIAASNGVIHLIDKVLAIP